MLPTPLLLWFVLIRSWLGVALWATTLLCPTVAAIMLLGATLLGAPLLLKAAGCEGDGGAGGSGGGGGGGAG